MTCLHMRLRQQRAYMEAQKVANTPFPFPLAQMADIILVMFSFGTGRCTPS
jgi:hypothetical protein